jgi:hypothetical protein
LLHKSEYWSQDESKIRGGDMGDNQIFPDTWSGGSDDDELDSVRGGLPPSLDDIGITKIKLLDREKKDTCRRMSIPI